MKVLVAVIRPEKLEEVEAALPTRAASVVSAAPVRRTRTRTGRKLLRVEVLVHDEALTSRVVTMLGIPGSDPDTERLDGIVFVGSGF